MVVDAGNRLRETGSRFLSGPILVRAVRVNRGVVDRGHRIGFGENDVVDQELKAARHDVRIDANHLVPQRAQDPGQRDLRTDTIAIGPGVADNGKLPAGQ